MPDPIPVFISYAHEDANYLKELQTFLKPLERKNAIKIWTDKNIIAGQQWDELIRKQLESSRIILFLISPDFLASDYINDTEMSDAIRRVNREELVLIPIIVRPIDMNLLQVKAYQVVPTGARAITKWEDRDEAWNDVLKALNNVFTHLNNNGFGIIQDSAGANAAVQLSTLDQKTFSTKVVSWLFIILIAACIGLFIFGAVRRDEFYHFTSLAGIGAGILGYFLAQKASR